MSGLPPLVPATPDDVPVLRQPLKDWVAGLSQSQAQTVLLREWQGTLSSSYTYVDELVCALSEGRIKYTSFVESLQQAGISVAVRDLLLRSLRQHGLPDDYHSALLLASSDASATEIMWKLSSMTVSRLWFLENWARTGRLSVFTQFIADWLTLQDVVRLDTAITNKKMRAIWLHDILRPLQSEGVDMFQHTPESIEWVRRKCSNVRKILTRESARANINDACFAEVADAAAAGPGEVAGAGAGAATALVPSQQQQPQPQPQQNQIQTQNQNQNQNLNQIQQPAPLLFPSLIHIELGSDNATHCAITTAGLTSIVKGCPKLVSLNLMHCDASDNGLRTIAKHCPRLAALSIKYCGKVTDAGIAALLGSCQRLEHLDVSWCNKLTDAALRFIGEKPLAALTSLDVSLCTLMTDVGVKALAKGCPLLRSLSLYACKNITDASLKALASGCPDLECLKLSLCEKVTNDGVVTLARSCPGLRNLNLSLCEKVTDVGIIELATNCPRLECCNCYGDKLLTDASLKALAAHCPSLASINLYRCELISDVGLEALCACKRLRIISVWNCHLVTAAAFLRCVAELPDLVSIDVRNCEGVSAAVIAETKKARPHLDLDGAMNSDKYAGL